MPRLQRHARYVPFTAVGLSIAILIAVGAVGPSAGVVRTRRDGLWPPWLAHLNLPDLAVAVAMWAALLLALATLVVLCLPGAWRPTPREPAPIPALVPPEPARTLEML